MTVPFFKHPLFRQALKIAGGVLIFYLLSEIVRQLRTNVRKGNS